MTQRRLSAAELERRSAQCRRSYAAAKARVKEVGFVCEGSLVERFMPCGKPTCHCATSGRLHGPYHQLSWKEQGRTVSRRLSASDAGIYREWIANRRKLESVLKQMRAVSARAGRYILEGASRSASGTKASRRTRRSDR